MILLVRSAWCDDTAGATDSVILIVMRGVLSSTTTRRSSFNISQFFLAICLATSTMPHEHLKYHITFSWSVPYGTRRARLQRVLEATITTRYTRGMWHDTTSQKAVSNSNMMIVVLNSSMWHHRVRHSHPADVVRFSATAASLDQCKLVKRSSSGHVRQSVSCIDNWNVMHKHHAAFVPGLPSWALQHNEVQYRRTGAVVLVL